MPGQESPQVTTISSDYGAIHTKSANTKENSTSISPLVSPSLDVNEPLDLIEAEEKNDVYWSTIKLHVNMLHFQCFPEQES